jgi:class 3 adenylate cyclase
VEVIAVSRRVQTLLFTDIVGSTDRLRDLEDAARTPNLVAQADELAARIQSGPPHP